MQFKQMFVTAVCVLFLLKLKWPKSKNFYETYFPVIQSRNISWLSGHRDCL